MSISACTIVAANCLAYARVVARSFRRHHPDVPFFVLLADDDHGRIDEAEEPFVLVRLADLGLDDLAGLCFRYDQQPLTYACTAALLRHLLDRGLDRIVYFKQETLVLASVAPLFDALAVAPAVMTPHLPVPLRGSEAGDREQVILQSGVYNVGVLGVSNHPVARRLLDWWHQRLLTHCRHDVPNGMHFEQRWLDLAPAFFDGVRVLGDPSFNIGHWSLPERQITHDASGTTLVDGQPLRVFRFSGFDPDAPDRITRYHDRLSWDSLGEVQRLIASVRDALFAEGHADVRAWPYAYATFDNGVTIPSLARRLYLEMGDAARRFGNPFATSEDHSYWHWLREPAPGTRVSRLWAAVHAERPDLQYAYPDLGGAGAGAFMNWARTFGVAEHRIDAQWAEEAPAEPGAAGEDGGAQ